MRRFSTHCFSFRLLEAQTFSGQVFAKEPFTFRISTKHTWPKQDQQQYEWKGVRTIALLVGPRTSHSTACIPRTYQYVTTSLSSWVEVKWLNLFGVTCPWVKQIGFHVARLKFACLANIKLLISQHLPKHHCQFSCPEVHRQCLNSGLQHVHDATKTTWKSMFFVFGKNCFIYIFSSHKQIWSN